MGGVTETDTARLEDLQWLLETGEHPARIPARLGLKPHALPRWLRRHGHRELAAMFERESRVR